MTPRILLALALVLPAFVPVASAGPFVEDVTEGDAPECPSTPLLTWLICYATNNPIVDRVRQEVENQTRIGLGSANFTRDRALDAARETLEYEHAVEAATTTFAGETTFNGVEYGQATQATAADNAAFARATVNGECRFYLGPDCLGRGPKGDQDEGSASSTPGFLEAGEQCPTPLVPWLLCVLTDHYMTAANLTYAQAWETYDRTAWSTWYFAWNQTGDTLDYEWAIELATYEYRDDLLGITSASVAYGYAVADEECRRLLMDPCEVVVQTGLFPLTA